MESLQISIAISEAINLRAQMKEGSLFYVALLNVSNCPLKLWVEDCSRGNNNLSLEIFALDGEALSQPIIVERGEAHWFRNNFHRITLEPGDVAVRAVRLYPYQPDDRLQPDIIRTDHVNYRGFPSLGPDVYPHSVRMRAIFTSTGDEQALADGLWQGTAVSETRDYTIWGPYL